MPPKLGEASPQEKVLDLYFRLAHTPRKHFQADLARELECSPQTITRMIDVIEGRLGRDTFIERGLDARRRYYRLSSKSQSEGLGFTYEELHFLATCRDLAAPHLPEGVYDRIGRTITSLALTLGEQAKPAGLPVGFRNKGHIDYAPHMETIARLRTSIEKRQVCNVIYTAGGRAKPETYRFAPGRIVVMNGTLYVQGYRLGEGSLLQDRPTTFSLHRISTVEPTGEYFGFNAAKGDARHFGLDWHKPKRMSVKVGKQAADYVRDRVWSDDQVIKNHRDGSLTLTVMTTSEKELQAWVWSFGGLAKIVGA